MNLVLTEKETSQKIDLLDRQSFIDQLKEIVGIQTFWPRLFKLPKHIPILLSIALLSAISASVFLIIKIKLATIISLILELILCGITSHLIERYQIKYSTDNFSEYKKYCINLKLWLADYDIKDIEAIKNIQSRILNKISTIKDEEQRTSDNTFKWLQTLIIPIIIAIVTAFISSDNDMTNTIVNVFTLLMLFFIIYGVYSIIKNIMNVSQKRKTQQLECFASDLQGVLDFYEE